MISTIKKETLTDGSDVYDVVVQIERKEFLFNMTDHRAAKFFKNMIDIGGVCDIQYLGLENS